MERGPFLLRMIHALFVRHYAVKIWRITTPENFTMRASRALLLIAIAALTACGGQSDPDGDPEQAANAIANISTETEDIADDGLVAADGAINDSESMDHAGNAPDDAD